MICEKNCRGLVDKSIQIDIQRFLLTHRGQDARTTIILPFDQKKRSQASPWIGDEKKSTSVFQASGFSQRQVLYKIRIISISKSLRLERSGRKQSPRISEIASYRRNDYYSSGFYINC